MPHLVRRLAPVVVALLLGACASPQSRIERSPDAFQALSPEQQALVRSGKIGLGLPEAAVRLALGDPDRVTQRTDGNGVATIWRYVERDPDQFVDGWYPGVGVYAAVGHPFGFYGGGPYGFAASRITTIQSSVERDHLRVTFVGGKVVAIEEDRSDPR